MTTTLPTAAAGSESIPSDRGGISGGTPAQQSPSRTTCDGAGTGAAAAPRVRLDVTDGLDMAARLYRHDPEAGERWRLEVFYLRGHSRRHDLICALDRLAAELEEADRLHLEAAWDAETYLAPPPRLGPWPPWRPTTVTTPATPDVDAIPY